MASGHVEKRTEDTFRIIINMGRDEEGKRKRITKTVKTKRKKDAEKVLRDMLTEIDRGTFVQPNNLLVRDMLDKWLRSKKADVAPSTYSSYSLIIDKHLNPTFGNYEAQELQSIAIEDYKNSLAGKKANRTIKYHLDVLDFAYKYAIKFNLVGKNPVATIDKPIRKKGKVDIFTPEQLENFEGFAREHRFFPIFFFAVRTGMRLGEIVGLQWDMVNGKMITVARQLQRIEGEGLVLSEILKTSSSYRQIGISATLSDMLKALPKHGPYVFCQENGHPHETNKPSKEFTKLTKKLKMKSNFHMLRHTHASFLLAAGLDIIKVQRRLGHERPSTTTDLYGHLIPNQKDEAGDIFENILLCHQSATKKDDEID